MGAATLTEASMAGASTEGASMAGGLRTAETSERRADAGLAAADVGLAAAVAAETSNHVVAAASTVVVADSTAAVAADSTAAVAADSTAVADMVVEVIANHPDLRERLAKCQPFFFAVKVAENYRRQPTRNILGSRRRSGTRTFGVLRRLARKDFWRLRVTPSHFGQRRAAGKFRERSVADVLEIDDADFAGVEGVASEIAHEGKENYSLAQGRIGFGVFAESDEVEDGFSLVGSAIQICSVVAVSAETVEPIQATTESELIFFVFAGEQIDKFGGAGFDSAARFL